MRILIFQNSNENIVRISVLKVFIASLGPFLENKVISKWKFQKICFLKNVVLINILQSNFFQKDSDFFTHRKLTLKVQFLLFFALFDQFVNVKLGRYKKKSFYSSDLGSKIYQDLVVRLEMFSHYICYWEGSLSMYMQQLAIHLK